MIRNTAIAPLLVLCALPQFALAAPTRWKIEADELVRIRNEPEVLSKANAMQVTVPPAILLRASDIKAGVWLGREIKSLEDLVLFMALSAHPKSGNLRESYKNLLPYSLSFELGGKVKVSSKGSQTLIEGLAELSSAGGPKGSYVLKTGSLSWQTLFDSKEGTVLSSNYDLKMDLELTYSQGNGAAPTTREYTAYAKGRLVLIDKGKRDPKQIRKEIQEAIARGAQWLESGSGAASAGAGMGPLALKLFALLRSGISPDSPVVQKGFETLLALPLERTYDVSLTIMAIEARSVRRDPPPANSSIPRYTRGVPPKSDLALIQKYANWLVTARNIGKGTWHYTAVSPAGEGKAPIVAHSFDNSNTQFAVLALHAAHRAGAKVPHEVWREIFEHFKSNQCGPEGSGRHAIGRQGEGDEKDGKKGSTVTRGGGSSDGLSYRGFAYVQGMGKAYGSMTNAGLSSLAIAAEMLKDARRYSAEDNSAFERIIAEGLAWNAKNFSVTENPGGASHGWYYYYMYSLEKACELLGVASFDGHDWYLEGADNLLALQDKEGSWARNPNDTALALLFLNRATLQTTLSILPRRATTGGPLGAEGQRDAVLIEKAGGLIALNALLEQILEADSKERRKLEKWFDEGVERIEELVRPIVMPGLIKALDSSSLKSWARKHLRNICQDSRLSKTEEFQDFYKQWEVLDQAPRTHDYDAIPVLRKVLDESKHAILRKLAMLTAVRLNALELADTLLKFYDSKKNDELSLATSCLGSLIGTPNPDPATVQAWIEKEQAAALKSQEPRRLIASALRGKKDDLEKVIKAGKTHMAELVRLTRDASLRNAAGEALAKITGLTMDLDAWSAWWASNESKLQADGRLPPPPTPKPGATPATPSPNPAPQTPTPKPSR